MFLREKYVDQLNSIRIWPYGFYGFFKKYRVALKKVVKGNVFDNFMTLAVTANTIIMAMDAHGISPETESMLTELNFVFTVIFIIEMSLKLIGLGVGSKFNKLIFKNTYLTK
jgi:putative Mn2+ efflux pump MntP